ncbi:hypothetical protein [Parachitinimonas caeni]|uniref:Uncharacterized protein n=1 Tax=Parachitinimonas caeni TaxID=3031301 RepID=A0ABT7E2H8_9NEIS|nr:hypothetical protein [Parachitinimonas caeni]MDK2126249.1 hypothetical protein [Parachitinimonas caeni]
MLDFMLIRDDGQELYSSNITHNLARMAEEAGIYTCLWAPDENSFTTAGQIIEPLASGVCLLATNRARFELFNADNGYGRWQDLLCFCAECLQACKDHPHATICVSR